MRHVQEEETIKRNANNMWNKYKAIPANESKDKKIVPGSEINRIAKKIQRGTAANKRKLNPTILDSTTKFLMPLIRNWKKEINKLSKKYVEEFCKMYGITNYFNSNDIESLVELLNDIDSYYKLRRGIIYKLSSPINEKNKI